jgi:5,10-methylene-tetrahydrofolate dehydrogenase/methenyl tetrahydrofolate cyclohydrolase
VSGPPTLIDGRSIRTAVLTAYRPFLEEITAANKTITVIRIAAAPDDPPQWRTRCLASTHSARAKTATFAALGYHVHDVELPADVSLARFRATLEQTNQDPAVTGCIVQLPVPARLTARIRELDPGKDTDQLTQPHATAVCATAEGMARLALGYLQPSDRIAVFGGKGFVGSGLVTRLNQLGFQPLVIDAGDPPTLTRDATVVFTTMGRPHWLTPAHLDGGQPRLLIDAGFTPTPGGPAIALGDIHPALLEHATIATPVPGGVGPVEMAVLAERVLQHDLGSRVPTWSYHPQHGVQLHSAAPPDLTRTYAQGMTRAPVRPSDLTHPREEPPGRASAHRGPELSR